MPVRPIIIAVVAFGYLISYPLVIGRADESHLLYGARRVLEGQVIYRDFFETITPLAYYLFAGVYRIAGTTLLAARATIAVIEAFGCVLLFRLVRRVASFPEATVATVIFAGICIPTWPYASWHWISTTLGLLVATVFLDERWRSSSRARPLVAGMLAGAGICLQQQRGVFLAAWLPLAAMVLGSSRPPAARWRTVWVDITAVAVGGTAVVLPILGLAAWAASPALLLKGIYQFAVQNYGPTQSGRTSWAAVPLMTQGWVPFTWVWLLRISPLFLVGEGLLLSFRWRHGRTEQDIERACLWLLAALMAAAIWYLPDFIHVSFVVPVLLIPGARLLYELRSRLRVPRASVVRWVTATLPCVLIFACTWKAVTNLKRARAAAPVRFETGFGLLQGDAAAEQLFRTVERHLVREPTGRALLYSFPDDAWLYLALPADNATRFSVIVPGFFPDAYVAEVTADLAARRPGTVVVAVPFVTKPMQATIDAGYELAEEFGPYRVYVRRGSRSP